MKKANILIIDDEAELRRLLKQLLTLEDYNVHEAGSLNGGYEILAKEEIHVIISDVKLPDGSGVDAVSKYKQLAPLAEVICLTAYGTIQDGVRAIKNGAFDYITKGDEDNKILPLVEKAFEKVSMIKRIQHLEERIDQQFNFDNILSTSPAVISLKEEAIRVAGTDVPVLITGETGTGKELFAQSIHNAGNRKNQPFVAVNCSAFTKDLLESEMFGYKAGAFTGANKNKKGLFEEANHGTLFLDEIGEMELSLQSKLLRALETNSFIKQGDTKPTFVDIRIITATNKNLNNEISAGHFRSDLYYRISLIKLEIPPLRERPEDIKPLAEFFISQFSKKINKPVITAEGLFFERLKNYNFPGNIRELRNIIERAVILCNESTLTSKYLPADLLQNAGMNESHKDSGPVVSLEQFERQHIIDALNKCQGNKTKTAELLGIGITTLYRKLQLFNIE